MSKTKNLGLITKEHFLLQTSTIPTGVTSSGSKYPINAGNTSIEHPNYPFGPTATPYLPLNYIYQNFSININGNWIKKIKPNDPVFLQRGSIKNEYTIQNLEYDIPSDTTNILLSNKRDVVHLLDSFISDTGYPNPSHDTFLSISRKVESPNSISNLVKSFSVKMTSSKSSDTFSIKASWKCDPTIKKTRLRWRSTPRNTVISSLSFNLDSQGTYTSIPTASVISTTGRRAKIEVSTSINEIAIDNPGSGYTHASAQLIGNGQDCVLSPNISSGQIVSIDVIDGGLNYTLNPSVLISGNGAGCSAHVSIFNVSGLNVIQQGGNYLTNPIVEIDNSTVISPALISSSLLLQNLGRIDYIKVLNGGAGYTGANVSITGGIEDATAEAIIKNGVITDIRLLTSGHGYTASNVTITPVGVSGAGASARANIDMYSEWNYELPSNYNEYSKTISGFKYNIPYEIEILSSTDENFRGICKYENTLFFQYYK